MAHVVLVQGTEQRRRTRDTMSCTIALLTTHKSVRSRHLLARLVMQMRLPMPHPSRRGYFRWNDEPGRFPMLGPGA